MGPTDPSIPGCPVNRIALCEFQPGLKFGGMTGKTQVQVTFYDQTTEVLFSFYPDEVELSSSEFVGLTRDEALDLYHRRDTLRS